MLSASSAAVSTALIAYWLPGAKGIRRFLRPLLGVRERLADAQAVALTFDDGPHTQGTPATLELLSDAGIRATFFLLGEAVVRRPALVAEIAAAGHEVGVHGYRHRSLLRMTPRELGDDLRRAVAAIGDVTGEAPRLYRPPYGVFSAAGLILPKALGWEAVYWSLPSFDWVEQETVESIGARLRNELFGGDIVLLHDSDAYCYPGSWRRTVAALPSLADAIERRGLTAVTL